MRGRGRSMDVLGSTWGGCNKPKKRGGRAFVKCESHFLEQFKSRPTTLQERAKQRRSQQLYLLHHNEQRGPCTCSGGTEAVKYGGEGAWYLRRLSEEEMTRQRCFISPAKPRAGGSARSCPLTPPNWHSEHLCPACMLCLVGDLRIAMLSDSHTTIP